MVAQRSLRWSQQSFHFGASAVYSNRKYILLVDFLTIDILSSYFPEHNRLITMAKKKVVVTRQLIEEAQKQLDARADEFEIVQWNSEKVSLVPESSSG